MHALRRGHELVEPASEFPTSPVRRIDQSKATRRKERSGHLVSQWAGGAANVMSRPGYWQSNHRTRCWDPELDHQTENANVDSRQ